MTTLYRPVLIESAELAEQLPIGTLAAPMYEDGPDFVYALVRRDETYEPWCNSDGSHARGHNELNGFVALVPVEVEEGDAVTVSPRGPVRICQTGGKILSDHPYYLAPSLDTRGEDAS